MKSLLLMGSSIVALLALPAHAQSVPSAPATESDDPGIADIIVTATKFETTLQKTPQAITTLDRDALTRAGVSTAQDLSKLVTGLNVETNGSNAAIFIRGIGSRPLSPTTDAAVAFSVDGIYYARNAGLSATLFDLDRVEVVKGPQGTLYGRNATGGAVNVITRHPQLGKRSMDGEIEVGNYGAIRAFAAVNLPIGETAAIRIAAQSTYNSGYLSDGNNDTNIKTGRIALTLKPSPDVSIYASVDYSAQGGRGPASVPIGPSVGNTPLATRFIVPNDPFVGPTDPRIANYIQTIAPPQAVTGPGPGTYCRAQVIGPPGAAGVPARLLCTNPSGISPFVDEGRLNNEFYGGNLTVEANLGFAQLTALGGYRHTKIDTIQRQDIQRQKNRYVSNQYSGEIRLSSPRDSDSALKWVLGAYYLTEKSTAASAIFTNEQAIGLPTLVCATAPVAGFCLARPSLIQNRFEVNDPAITNETYAGFGQATFSLTKWLRVTGGVRFTHETRGSQGQITTYYTFPAGLVSSYPSKGSASFNDTSYRVGIEVDVAPRSMLYGHVSTAFHAGGFNLGVATGLNPYLFAPEKVTSYVAGIKNRFFNNRLQLNIEGFWLDYNNYQFNSLGRVNDGTPACSAVATACPITLRTDNAKGARIRGVEADIVLRVMEHGTLDFNALYNDGRFVSFDIRNVFTGAITSYAGRELPAVNKWTIGAGYTQIFPTADGGRVVAAVRTQYRNGKYLWFNQTPSQYQPAYTRTDFSLGYEARERRWDIKAFVRNIEGTATTFQGASNEPNTGLLFTILNPPRTYGIALGFHF